MNIITMQVLNNEDYFYLQVHCIIIIRNCSNMGKLPEKPVS